MTKIFYNLFTSVRERKRKKSYLCMLWPSRYLHRKVRNWIFFPKRFAVGQRTNKSWEKRRIFVSVYVMQCGESMDGKQSIFFFRLVKCFTAALYLYKFGICAAIVYLDYFNLLSFFVLRWIYNCRSVLATFFRIQFSSFFFFCILLENGAKKIEKESGCWWLWW